MKAINRRTFNDIAVQVLREVLVSVQLEGELVAIVQQHLAAKGDALESAKHAERGVLVAIIEAKIMNKIEIAKKREF